MMRSRLRHARSGLSLLEVIVSTAIFVGAAAMLGELLQLGLTANRSNTRTTIALLLCESKLEEIVAGVSPLSDAGTEKEIDGFPGWRLLFEIDPLSVTSLYRLKVTVEHLDHETEEPDFSFTLERWVVVPEKATPSEETERLGDRPTVRQMLGLPEANE